ncbi:unnamed protein product [Allacma fusca]|uniref:Uncharacterized protein n=1 Tax=Allacma fusca TaxID=39272 RepID=A0A8J2P0A1_9HEXA|nr:unnamed protein product [Allacma fusca]
MSSTVKSKSMEIMSYQWFGDAEAYKRKKKGKNVLQLLPAEKHPLHSQLHTINVKQKLKPDPLDGLDPLSLNELDPLTRMAVGCDYNPEFAVKSDNFEPWNSKKVAILNKFTTQEKLSITTSYFAADHEVRGVSEKVLHRLEQLDLDCGSKQYFGGLTQEEYINKINQLDQQLSQAWNADLRVNALKISIQCCKLLGDSSVVSFYPSKFVIITDILDKFGEMVYHRLKGKQNDMHSAEVAKETCKNWFFKVGSIRELLPRICLELAILKSYAFIQPQPEYGRILSRLLNSMWGIGDPVVAIYMRCYLCRKAMELVPNNRELYMQSFQDLLLLHDQAFDNFRHNPQFVEAKVAMETYMSILSPAVDWILQCLVHRGEHLIYVIQLVSNLPPFWKSLLISSVLSTFPPTFIGEECLHILEMILTLENNLGAILRNLGLCLILIDPAHQQAKEIWNLVWPSVRSVQDRNQYLSCCQVWVEFAVKHFGSDTISSVLEDVMEHVRYRDADQLHGQLASIIEKLLTYSNDITQLLHMDKFIKMVTMLNVDTVKNVISTFNAKHPEPAGNNIVVNTLLHLATIVHDSVDALTPVDEVKQIGNLINGYILRVNFGRDFEKQLQFYDEARGAFSNIDAILVQLVQCVCSLGMKVRRLVDGHHTKRTRAFLSACVAYSFITIPSLENSFTQLQLYLLSSQVAYSNQCVSQGESCLKAIVTVLHESSVADFDCGETILLEYMSNLLSTFLAVPDHPKESMLYLLKALINIEWIFPSVYVQALSLVGAYSQEKYAYHFSGVDANDGLYGGEEKFVNELDATGTSVLNEILNIVKTYGEQNQIKKQAKLSLDLFNEILIWGDVDQMWNLAVNLWNFSRKNVDHKLAVRTLETIRRKAFYRKEFQYLASKITMD